MRLDDDRFVRDQYRSTARLEARISVWHPDAAGRWPQDVALAALADHAPSRLLEVGCGTGAFAARCAAELACEVIALDSSPEMVRATAARGIDARVLRPGGRLIAVTNGNESLRELYDLAGGAKLDSAFSRENGTELLSPHFAHVHRTDVETRAVFDDRAAAAAYLATLGRDDLAERLPEFAEPLVASGAPTIFAADKG